MRSGWRHGGGLVCLLIGLAACAPAEQPRRKTVKEAPPARDLVAEVRAAAADAGDVIEVAPLRDPAVDDLLWRAQQAEGKRLWRRADKALREAIALSPNDPEILQRHAEVLLARAELDEAERLAARSYTLGPKLGGLCRRNWATVRIAREQRGDLAGAQTAARQLQSCVVEPPVRM